MTGYVLAGEMFGGWRRSYLFVLELDQTRLVDDDLILLVLAVLE